MGIVYRFRSQDTASGGLSCRGGADHGSSGEFNFEEMAHTFVVQWRILVFDLLCCIPDSEHDWEMISTECNECENNLAVAVHGSVAQNGGQIVRTDQSRDVG